LKELEKKFEERYEQIQQSINHNKGQIIILIKDENVREAESSFIQLKKRLLELRLLKEIKESL
jgi:hypothetical protein